MSRLGGGKKNLFFLGCYNVNVLQYEIPVTILRCLLLFFADAPLSAVAASTIEHYQLYVRTLDFDRIQIMILRLCHSLWTHSIQSVPMYFNYPGIISVRNHVGKTHCYADEVSE